MGVIRSGNVIFLDSSTSNMELARLLVDSELNVTVAELAGEPQNEIIARTAYEDIS